MLQTLGNHNNFPAYQCSYSFSSDIKSFWVAIPQVGCFYISMDSIKLNLIDKCPINDNTNDAEYFLDTSIKDDSKNKNSENP